MDNTHLDPDREHQDRMDRLSKRQAQIRHALLDGEGDEAELRHFGTDLPNETGRVVTEGDRDTYYGRSGHVYVAYSLTPLQVGLYAVQGHLRILAEVRLCRTG